MTDLRWGVIGAGDVCERKSGPPLYRVPRSRLVLVHRRDRAAGEEFVRRHAGRFVGELDALLESDEIDAVYVATPHALHAEHTVAALEAGKHVLVEKPMALRASDCDAMIAAAKRAKRSLAVAYYRRGYESIRRTKALIDDQVIGRVTSMSINNEFPTSHRLDLVHHLLGPIARVRMTPTDESGYSFERMTSRIEARTESGVEVVMAGTWAETGMPEAVQITGVQGSIHIVDLKRGSLVVRIGATAEPNGESGLPNVRRLECGGLPYTHWGLIEDYVAHVLDGTRLLCDGYEGRRSTLILDTLSEAEAGERATVSY